MKLTLSFFFLRMLLTVSPAFCVASCATKAVMIDLAPQFALSKQYFQSGSYEQGYALLDDIAARYPNSPDATLGLGDAYYGLGAYEKAAIFYREADQLNPDIRAKLGEAKVELARNNSPGAQNIYNAILQQDPASPEAFNGLGVTLDLAGQHVSAQAMYHKALSFAPLYTEPANNLALSLGLSGQAKYGATRMAEIYRSNITNETLRQNLAILDYLKGDPGTARTIAAMDISSADAEKNFSTLSRILHKR